MYIYSKEKNKEIIEGKSTLTGPKKDTKTALWASIGVIIGRTGDECSNCWKNLRKRTIEKNRMIDSARNKTGGGLSGPLPSITELDEAILRIVNFAQPLKVLDSNSIATDEASEDGKTKQSPVPKRIKTMNSAVENANKENDIQQYERQIATCNQLQSEKEMLLKSHESSLTCYSKLVALKESNPQNFTKELSQLTRLHLNAILQTGSLIFGVPLFEKENEPPAQMNQPDQTDVSNVFAEEYLNSQLFEDIH